MIEIEEMYTRELVKANPNKIYVFGDNLHRKGIGGQAIIRGLPNTFGIATKAKPSQINDSYFSDSRFNLYFDMIKTDIEGLMFLRDQGKTIVFPKGGLGTGLSDMPNKCPVLFRVMNEMLLKEFGFDNTTGRLVKQIN